MKIKERITEAAGRIGGIEPDAVKVFLTEQSIGRPGRVDEIATAGLWL